MCGRKLREARAYRSIAAESRIGRIKTAQFPSGTNSPRGRRPSSEMRNPLHSICPYFAMFPEDFVRKYVRDYTKPGAVVFASFSGRGTPLLESLLNDRHAAAIDINPVAYCISAAKATIP